MPNASGALQPSVIKLSSHHLDGAAVTSAISKETLKYINICKFVVKWFGDKSRHDEYLRIKLEEALREAEKVC
jgi:hypothetical protein